MKYNRWRFVVALVLSVAALASPALSRHVSAASSQAGGETLMYHSSWRTGTLGWTVHHMTWSISGGILTLRQPVLPVGPSGDDGWIIAPYRPTPTESFAIEAVMKVSPAPRPVSWGWGGEVMLTAHFGHLGPHGLGVSGAYFMGAPYGEGAAIYDPGASVVGPGGNPVGFNSAGVVHLTHWNTYRLEVRANGIRRPDSYSFRINGVQIAEAQLGDWMQSNRIALSASYSLVVQVKSIKVYRLH